ncbi:MAG TPA: N-acetylmuramic acid 6-phosphate etherase [Acholeplasmataceae bacterium]|nr:N-acetylmuramic acid 6-phosphate etherase [Acholeplasmataceae bacterium]HRX44672.1 N-acetylmuramic acid 6-phosphate etherase [Acholeplasmataceae bacterium]
MLDISKISTEKRNENTKNIDIASTKQILQMINDEDKTVAFAVEKAIDQITVVVDIVSDVFRQGGRLIYIGAGTSGRLGVLDASECPPTFGVPNKMVTGIIAGGDKALRTPIEGVEDSKEQARKDLQKTKLTEHDIVIGIAASGRTPYVIGGIEYAKSIGAKTACITTSENSEIAKVADHPIEAITGAEPLTGSTRMKSGTAQKLILNMITTASMVKLGKVYENLMIDVAMSNNKLISRATNIVMEVTGCSQEVAEAYLTRYNSVKYAIFGIMSHIEDKNKIKEMLNEHHGNIRESLKKL